MLAPTARGRPRWILACCGLSALLIGCTAPAQDAQEEQSTTTAEASSQQSHGAAGAGHPYYPKAGNGGYDVRDYHVSLSYDPAHEGIDAETTVTATALRTLSRFNLDLRGLEVESVTVNGDEAEFTRAGEFELVITPPNELERDSEFRTHVVYSGVPTNDDAESLGTNGWSRDESGSVYVLGEPNSASYWYPANDTPRDKATFHLDARVPEGWSAISIGTLEGRDSQDGWTTWRWAQQTPTAPYLTTLAVDKFQIERAELADGTPVLSAYAPGAADMRSMGSRVGEVVSFLEGKFGPYPGDTAGGIYLGSFIGFSLETQGRPTYTASAGMPVVVHEIAHEWYGNSVSVRSWADICLNECLASYAMWLWAAGENGLDLDQRYRRQIEQFGDDTDFWGAKLYDMGAGNEFTGVYSKGPMAIHALRRRIGEQAFNTVLREWPVKHEDGNASWPQFEQFVTEVSGQDLRGFFDAWFRGNTIPADEHLYPGSLGN